MVKTGPALCSHPVRIQHAGSPQLLSRFDGEGTSSGHNLQGFFRPERTAAVFVEEIWSDPATWRARVALPISRLVICYGTQCRVRAQKEAANKQEEEVSSGREGRGRGRERGAQAAHLAAIPLQGV